MPRWAGWQSGVRWRVRVVPPDDIVWASKRPKPCPGCCGMCQGRWRRRDPISGDASRLWYARGVPCKASTKGRDQRQVKSSTRGELHTLLPTAIGGRVRSASGAIVPMNRAPRAAEKKTNRSAAPRAGPRGDAREGGTTAGDASGDDYARYPEAHDDFAHKRRLRRAPAGFTRLCAHQRLSAATPPKPNPETGAARLSKNWNRNHKTTNIGRKIVAYGV